MKGSVTPHTKRNSKWLKALNTRRDTIKLLEENIGKTSSVINHSNVFLGQSPKATLIKAQISKWYLIELRSFCTAKEAINKIKTQSIDWEKIFENNVTYKSLISKTYKHLIQPGEGNGNPLQYSCPENLMDRGTWWATVHRVSKNQTRLSD